MAETTNIEWADATFNPWVGCTKISPACDHCYAEAWAKRAGKPGLWSDSQRQRTSVANWQQPLKWQKELEIAGGRRRVFCASLADVFDNIVPVTWRIDLFELIHATPNLDWLLLSKRIGNAMPMINQVFFEIGYRTGEAGRVPQGMWAWPWANVWLGATVVTQEELDRDVPKLLDTAARIRFLSIEPLLGPIDLTTLQHLKMIDWIIVGGESGPGARPMNPEWVRSLRDQCASAGIPFLFKQWGEWGPERVAPVADSHRWPIDDRDPFGGLWSYRAGKKRAGRLLDGREHTAFPA